MLSIVGCLTQAAWGWALEGLGHWGGAKRRAGAEMPRERSDPRVQRPVRRVRRGATGIAHIHLCFSMVCAMVCCTRAPGK